MRTLATFASSFAAGIFLAQSLLPPSWLPLCAAVCFVLACGGLLSGRHGRRVVLVGVGLCLALGYDWLYIRQVQRPAEALADTCQTAEMTLCDYALPTDYGARVTVRLAGLPGKAVYYGDETLLDLAPGQTVETTVYFQSAGRIQDTDVTTFTSKGVFLLAYARGQAVYGPGSAASPRWWPVRVGRAMQTQIQILFDGDDAGFLTAILTGDKSGLSQSASTDLSQAGLYHILAVSGMHCMFLLSAVTLLAGRHRRRLIAAWALPLLCFYALLTGGSPSVVRACIMAAFLLAAPLCGRESDGPTALSAALLVILLDNPFAAASVSLQLSFAAMAGILFLTPRLYRMLKTGKKHGKLFAFTASGFSATMGALVFTIPLTAYYFGILVLVSPLTNLLCLWAAGIVFLGGLLAVLASFLFLPLGFLLGLVPRALLWYILHAVHLLARLPYHAVYFTNPYLKYWLGYTYLFFAAVGVLRVTARRTYALAASLAAAALAVTVHLGALRWDAAALHVLALDVGQGESVLLDSGGTFALIDCGSSNGWYDAGQIAADHLHGMGCTTLDYLVLTHYDADHINGVTALMERLPVAMLLVPQAESGTALEEAMLTAAEKHGTAVEVVTEKRDLSVGLAVFTVYPPVGQMGDNERGLSVLASVEDWDVLVTGDMDSDTEQTLLGRYPLPDIEALVVGHHGSKNATSAQLLAALRPETAIISVGDNHYGHPTDEALRRLVTAGADVYRTDMQGTIHLTVN